MRTHVFARALRDWRRGFIGWGVGIVILVMFNNAFYPSLRDTDLDAMLKDLPDFAKSFIGEQSLTSPAGYLESQFFLFMTPLLFLIFAIGRGADVLAGEESRHTLDLLMANPVKRGRALVEKAAALLTSLVALGGVFLLVLWLSAELFDMDIGIVDLVVATAGSLGVAATFGALALAVGAATGKKAMADAASAGLAALGYFVNSLGNQVDELEPLRPTSPFYYGVGDSPLGGSITWMDGAILVAIVAVLLTIAVYAFDRRDLSV